MLSTREAIRSFHNRIGKQRETKGNKERRETEVCTALCLPVNSRGPPSIHPPVDSPRRVFLVFLLPCVAEFFEGRRVGSERSGGRYRGRCHAGRLCGAPCGGRQAPRWIVGVAAVAFSVLFTNVSASLVVMVVTAFEFDDCFF